MTFTQVLFLDQLIKEISLPGVAEWLTPEDNAPFGLNLLVLENIRESANYTCEAASVLGVIERTTVVKVRCEFDFHYILIILFVLKTS